ncbi:MAG: type III pantothenate kinase [Planctomycetaceae bacterium]|nr:type III pantothenate kinase [Planctomycetaceae bacterium]
MADESSFTVLAIDVGNTRAKFGLFRCKVGAKSESASEKHEFGSANRHSAASPIESVPAAIAIVASVLEKAVAPGEMLREWTRSLPCDLPKIAVVAGSEVDQRDQLVSDWPLDRCRPVVIDHFGQIPIGVDVEMPDRVGIDRLLDCWAAWQMTGCRNAVIAVDSGTATTVDLLTSDGIFRGGSILPGLRLSAHAMHDYTARLPLLNTDAEQIELPLLPGRNTEDAMRAGLFIGQLGAVRELVQRLNEANCRIGRTTSGSPVATELASGPETSTPPSLFVTGGGGRQLVRHLPGALFVDSLALHGLAMLAPIEV